MKRFLLLACLCLLIETSIGQNTVGLISYDATSAQDGYNLYFPHNQSTVYLLDNCGRVVLDWEDEDETYKPGNSVYLSEDGLLYKCKGKGALSNEWIHAGGGGETLEIRDMENNLIWQWAYNDSLVRLHHDIAVMPNGNILAIAWERKFEDEVIQAGRDTSISETDELWPDHIIEVEPVGADDANIVWEWHAWDHMVQNFDETKDNFGNIADPKLIDINFTPDGSPDWHHMNAIDYNHDLDQIILSVPTFNEMWIIDHSTTTELAAGHNGGFSGIGGDLMFRWGNPAAYASGDTLDQKLFFQHDTHWIDLTLTNSHPDYGKIMVFNNRVTDTYSTVGIINPTFDSYEWNYSSTDGIFDPVDFEWTYTRPEPEGLYSTGLSNVQRLENGNTLICEGRYGDSFEIDEDENVVWEYINPMISGTPVEQGTELAINQNIQFRMNRYPTDFGAFDGLDLSGLYYIELNPVTPDEVECPLLVSVDEIQKSGVLTIYPNPSQGIVSLNLEGFNGNILHLELFDAQGRLLRSEQLNYSGQMEVDVSELTSGMYILRLKGEGLNLTQELIKE